MSSVLGLATTAIAALALSITLGQWHTARSKLALDLFNQRMDIYRKICLAIGKTINYGECNTNAALELAPLRHEASFLFGDDVNDCIERAQKAMLRVGQSGRAIASGAGNQAAHQDTNQQQLEILTSTYNELPILVRKYCRMDQKLPPSATELRAIAISAWQQLLKIKRLIFRDARHPPPAPE
jgi:hypothetical protein